MVRIVNLEAAQLDILKRQGWEDDSSDEIAQSVRTVLANVRTGGDDALLAYTEKFDGTKLDAVSMRVRPEQIDAAIQQVDPDVMQALIVAANRVRAFHERQPTGSWFHAEGGLLGQKICPIGRVACYVPGGTAALASTLIMTALVAKAAGVPEVCIASPPQRSTGMIAPVILAAASICGIDEVWCMGGAQAIAALAYGTATIKAVDKICGPGNAYVMHAKRLVYGRVGIDALPGPTETAIVADEDARPDWLAADLLAQAEHNGGTSILFTPSRKLAERVAREIELQTMKLASSTEIRESFAKRSAIVITHDIAEAVASADQFAPEHLCLSVRDPWAWIGSINRAGGVFMGEFSCEVLGDYVAGPSHTMPTGGTARFASPCNVWDFVRVQSVIALDENTSRQLAPAAHVLANAEGLPAHAAAAKLRMM